MERDRGRSGHQADTGFSYLHTVTITVLPSLWPSSPPLSHYQLLLLSPILYYTIRQNQLEKLEAAKAA